MAKKKWREIARKKIAAQWKSVRASQDYIAANVAAGAVNILGVPQDSRFQDGAHTLLLFFAFAVLELALRTARQREIRERPDLNRRMKASKPLLPWQDYATVSQARKRRNAVAHRWQVIPRAETAKYINAIEDEFIAWGIVRGPFRPRAKGLRSRMR
jgi:hypothetical protein